MHTWDRHTPIEETLRALDDLVRTGKVRYVGFSDAPAWKVAQAQTLAQLRGIAPLTALQIEYSLLERTVEGELVPAAVELGMGITPWSPLKGGVLSGKYTRANAGAIRADRSWVNGQLTEPVYALVDELIEISRELESTPARVALAWLQARPGVSSTIIGARTFEQLDDNLAALEVRLAPKHVAELDRLSKPALNFPAVMLERAATYMHPGLTINGHAGAPNP